MTAVRFLVVGSPRSGTTLVQRLASELPGVAMPPETHFFDLFFPKALKRGAPPWDRERILAELDIWAAMPQMAGLSIDANAVLQRCGGHCESASQLFEALVAELTPGGTVLGEKTPHHLLWWQPIARAMPEIKFIGVVRDPRDVVASNLAAPWASRMVGPEWGTDLYVAAAELWRAEQRQLRQLLAALPDRAMLLHYEQMVDSPAAAKQQIADFLGVSAGSAVESVPASSYMLAHETWKDRVTGPITASRIGGGDAMLGVWRSSLVALLCRDQAGPLGYPLSVAAASRGLARLATLRLMTIRLLRGLRARVRIQANEREQVSL
jgi:hypothetical protein